MKHTISCSCPGSFLLDKHGPVLMVHSPSSTADSVVLMPSVPGHKLGDQSLTKIPPTGATWCFFLWPHSDLAQPSTRMSFQDWIKADVLQERDHGAGKWIKERKRTTAPWGWGQPVTTDLQLCACHSFLQQSFRVICYRAAYKLSGNAFQGFQGAT